MRVLVLLYGVVAYVLFLGSFLYAIGFVGNFAVPKSIDSGTDGPLGQSILIDAILLSLFAIQHTIMARPGFKARWTRIVSPAIERSTFVLVTSLLLGLIMWQWQPIPNEIWSVGGVLGMALWGLFALGFGIVLISTFLIDHFDLFGLRQVVSHFRGQDIPAHQFVERSLYGLVRHPIMLGFVIAFWATPQMTGGHLLWAAMTTAYIVFGVHVEERDLLAAHGEVYAGYRRRVPMLLPLPKGKRG